MTHAAAVARLRIVARSVMASLPREARRVLKGTVVQVGVLGFFNAEGQKLQGSARKDGKLVVLDQDFVNTADEVDVEEALAHELGHIFRTRTGQHSEDDSIEETETGRLVEKSWGFRTREYRYANRNRYGP